MCQAFIMHILFSTYNNNNKNDCKDSYPTSCFLVIPKCESEVTNRWDLLFSVQNVPPLDPHMTGSFPSSPW